MLGKQMVPQEAAMFLLKMPKDKNTEKEVTCDSSICSIKLDSTINEQKSSLSKHHK
jgi:hypothetical protein